MGGDLLQFNRFQALAAYGGRMSSPGIHAIFDHDTSLTPDVQALMLIPEPDGSPTDDFVIPERFQRRVLSMPHRIAPP